jgi:hypothetical protein
VALNSARKIWWRCQKCSEEWKTSPVYRSKGRSGCPICRPRLAGVDKAPPLSKSHPKLAKQWHPTKNGPWTPHDLTAGSNIKVWWQCPSAPDHVWEGIIQTRTTSSTQTMGCPFCDSKRAAKGNCLSTLFPDVAALLHPTKNRTLTADMLIAGSGKRVWWLCAQDHEWKERVSALTLAGQRCPYCANQRVSKTNSVAAHSPPLIEQWHPTKNGNLTPAAVIAGSHKKVWWKCAAGPDHEWEEMPLKRCYQNVGCPFCSHHRASVTNSLATLDPALAKQCLAVANKEEILPIVLHRQNQSSRASI